MQKQSMYHRMIRPHTTAIRKYAARLAEINGYLNDFLLHQPNQPIPMDELLEILEFVIPVSWQHQMTRHGKDPLQQMIVQFLQFCKCLESVAQVPTGTNPKQVHGDKNEDMQGPAGKSCKCSARHYQSNGQTSTEEKYSVKLVKEIT